MADAVSRRYGYGIISQMIFNEIRQPASGGGQQCSIIADATQNPVGTRSPGTGRGLIAPQHNDAQGTVEHIIRSVTGGRKFVYGIDRCNSCSPGTQGQRFFNDLGFGIHQQISRCVVNFDQRTLSVSP